MIPLTLKTTGSIPAQDQLLTLIQTVGPRRALVTSADFQPGTGANTASITSDASMTIQLQIFVAPQTPAAVAELQKQLASAPGH